MSIPKANPEATAALDKFLSPSSRIHFKIITMT
jgi:hypothetical protein